MQSSDMSKFMKHLRKASHKLQEKEKARDELKKKVSRLRKLSSKKNTKKETVEKAIEDMELCMMEVIEKEKKILHNSEENSKFNKNIQKKIDDLEEDVGNVSHYEYYSFKSLRDKISSLEEEIGHFKRYKGDVEEFKKKIDELKEKIDGYDAAKRERDKRVMELEKKIKSKVKGNFNEILKIEEQIKNIEKRYEEARAKGYSKEDLAKMKFKLDSFKQKIGKTKKMSYEAPIKERPGYKKIKHDIDIKPVASLPKPEKEIEFKHKEQEFPPLKKPKKKVVDTIKNFFKGKEKSKKNIEKELPPMPKPKDIYHEMKGMKPVQNIPRMPKMPAPPKPEKNIFDKFVNWLKGY